MAKCLFRAVGSRLRDRYPATLKGTRTVKRSWRSRIRVDVGDDGVVSLAGASLLTTTAQVLGLDRGLSKRLSGWTPLGARHDPGKIVFDLALALGVGGDCPADIAVLRGQPRLFGAVASDSTVSRRVDLLAADVDDAVAAIRGARMQARALRLRLAPLPTDVSLPVDIDATILIAHSDKEDATPTYKRTFGHSPLLAYLDHGEGGTGEPLAVKLRPGRANANNAADNIAVLDDALAQLPAAERGRVLVRTDAAGGTHAFLHAVTELGLEYSVGFPVTSPVAAALRELPEQAWTPAYDGTGQRRDGADVAELTALLDLSEWPAGMRVIVRRERPHPGAQLRVTDVDGNRITCFATNTRTGHLAALEQRHRNRARCEDRIRCGKDTGMGNLPYQDNASNRIWLEIVQLAEDLIAWLQALSLTGKHRVAEPKRLRLYLFTVAGRLIRTARRTRLRLDRTWPWARDIDHAMARLHALAPG